MQIAYLPLSFKLSKHLKARHDLGQVLEPAAAYADKQPHLDQPWPCQMRQERSILPPSVCMKADRAPTFPPSTWQADIVASALS